MPDEEYKPHELIRALHFAFEHRASESKELRSLGGVKGGNSQRNWGQALRTLRNSYILEMPYPKVPLSLGRVKAILGRTFPAAQLSSYCSYCFNTGAKQ
jgi:hypothetical protein